MERGNTLRRRAVVLAVGALAATGVAACTASKDISVGGQAYHIKSTDQLNSTNGQAWLMDQFKVDQATAQCMAGKLSDAGITNVDQTTQQKNAEKNTAAQQACAGTG
jgi:hypothetical protein